MTESSPASSTAERTPRAPAARWRELPIVLVCALPGLAVAALSGDSGWGVAVGAIGYLGWHLWNLARMLRWLTRRKRGSLGVGRGVWGDAFAALERLERRNRKRKKRLHKVAARFEEATEASPDATLILRDDGVVLWVNSAARRLLGVDRGVPDSLGDARLDAYLAAGRFEDPLEIPAPANRDLWLLVRVVPYGANRRLVQARDITRLQRLEAIRRDFVANVSHELRSPLTVIVGYLESMDEDPELAAGWRHPLELMNQQARRMTRLVEDLLRLARLEGDPGGAPHDPVDLAELALGIGGDARDISHGSHQVEVDAERDVVVFGEADELYSAFANLAFNAIQHTPAGGCVRLRCRRDGDRALFEVADDGPGISPEHLPRLTERFYRVDKARSRAVGGTGLGLAIVKHVLMRHEATLAVDSAAGSGSRFSCQFPASRVAPVASIAASG